MNISVGSEATYLNFRVSMIIKYGVPIFRVNTISPKKLCRLRSDANNAASDLGLHCLPLIQQFADTSTVSKLDLFKF